VTKAVAIDTNLLILLVVGLTNPEYVRRHRRLTPVYNPAHFELIRRLLIQEPRVFCTSHILAEGSNLLRQTGEPMRSEIMATYSRFIQSAEEPYLAAKEAAQSPSFIRLGLTDAALLSLDPKAVRVMTVDHDLHIACSERGFDVVNLTPFLYE
jgi:hypothetical protein